MSRLAVLAAGLAGTVVIAASGGAARADFLDRSLGSWALGGSANCGVPSKFYTLTTYGGNITWRNGTGSVDIETVISSNDQEFQTVTINSIHRSGGGYARGTAWTYTRTGSGFMQVVAGNETAFVLGRCF